LVNRATSAFGTIPFHQPTEKTSLMAAAANLLPDAPRGCGFAHEQGAGAD
jgi:hypothetical protein